MLLLFTDYCPFRVQFKGCCWGFCQHGQDLSGRLGFHEKVKYEIAKMLYGKYPPLAAIEKIVLPKIIHERLQGVYAVGFGFNGLQHLRGSDGPHI